MDQAENILSKAVMLFLQYGAKSVTMDDIARELGISKKTLYQFVENKADLVQQTVRFYLQQEKKQLASISRTSGNAIDDMVKTASFLARHLSSFNPSILYDMQKYFPKAWELYERYKFDFVYSRLVANMERGRREGLYRDDFDIDIVTRLYIGKIDLILDLQLFPTPDYKAVEVHREYLRYHIRSIATEQGMQILKTLENEPNESK